MALHRHLRFMAKAELYRSRPFAWLLRSAGAFKVERGKSDMAAVERAIELARGGELVCIFPEGTRNRDGAGKPFSGAARMKITAGVPMIPVAVSGTDRVRLWPPRLPQFTCAFGVAAAGRRPRRARGTLAGAAADRALVGGDRGAARRLLSSRQVRTTNASGRSTMRQPELGGEAGAEPDARQVVVADVVAGHQRPQVGRQGRGLDQVDLAVDEVDERVARDAVGHGASVPGAA